MLCWNTSRGCVLPSWFHALWDNGSFRLCWARGNGAGVMIMYLLEACKKLEKMLRSSITVFHVQYPHWWGFWFLWPGFRKFARPHSLSSAHASYSPSILNKNITRPFYLSIHKSNPRKTFEAYLSYAARFWDTSCVLSQVPCHQNVCSLLKYKEGRVSFAYPWA